MMTVSVSNFASEGKIVSEMTGEFESHSERENFSVYLALLCLHCLSTLKAEWEGFYGTLNAVLLQKGFDKGHFSLK